MTIRNKVITYILVMLAVITISIIFLVHLPNDGENKVYFDFALVIAISCMLVIGVLLYVLLFLKKKLEMIFLLSYISLGLIYNFVMTPISPPDEVFHWGWTMRNVTVLLEDRENFDRFDVNRAFMEGTTNHANDKEAYAFIMSSLFVPDDAEPEYVDSWMGFAYPLQYIPQSIGLLIGRLLPLSKYMEFYLGRLFNLVFSAVLLYFAIKIIPAKYNVSVVVIALLPMFLHQSASYSNDVFINSMSILLVSLILREVYSEEKLKTSRYVLITAIAVLLAPAKYVYSLFILLILLIPGDHYKSKADRIIRPLIAIGFAFASATLGYYSFYMYYTTNPTTAMMESPAFYTNAFILNNPVQTMRIFASTTLHMMPLYIDSAFGRYLSGFSLQINAYLIYCFMALFAVSFFTGNTDEEMDGNKQVIGSAVDVRLRLLLVFIAGAIYLGILYAMFTGFTYDYLTIIDGVQGRYFIPLLLPIAVVLSNRLFVFMKNHDKQIIFAAVLLNIFVVFEVMQKTIEV